MNNAAEYRALNLATRVTHDMGYKYDKDTVLINQFETMFCFFLYSVEEYQCNIDVSFMYYTFYFE